LVTGATRGLGRQFAHSLAEAGADIIIHGRDEVAAAEVAASIEALGRTAHVLTGDLTRQESVEAIVADAISFAGRIDVLVNNAGACTHRPALEVTPDEWSHVIDTNLTALWHVSQAVGR